MLVIEVRTLSTLSMFGFAAMKAKRKAMCTGFLLAFILGVLEAHIIVNPPDPWYDGYMTCRQNNMAMLSWRMWRDGTRNINVTYPVWLYGFEAKVRNTVKIFTFDQLQNNMTASVRCVRGNTFDEYYQSFNFEQALSLCQNNSSGYHMELLSVNHTNLHKFPISSDIINFAFWTKGLEVGTFLNSENLTTRCFLLNADGALRKDNCTESYASICVNAIVRDTIQYNGQLSNVPHYDPTSTSKPVTLSAATSEFVTSQVSTATNEASTSQSPESKSTASSTTESLKFVYIGIVLGFFVLVVITAAVIVIITKNIVMNMSQTTLTLLCRGESMKHWQTVV
ncbi:uncharacterized protein LOC127862346 isoform X2 [Dreissena polymorpha]|uniref:uncharacterized protein LOC127862346 isoform X2 n=1 Tax=Dreissena polymorpha TaxID=45954 RepID=UPI002264C542|nr:uncharacterized protein LOC127862346 isoform X2 [Dreissena polymorpha]